MMKIKLIATTDKPPIRYRFNGGAWQDSPIFEVPLGAYPYTFEAIDADDCIETFIVTEPPLEVFSYGAYFDHDTTEIHVTWTTNIPATSQIEWSFNDDDTDFNTTPVHATLKLRHDVKFPQIALGGSHWFRVRSTSPLGQMAQSRYLGIICIPGEITISASSLLVIELVDGQWQVLPELVLYDVNGFDLIADYKFEVIVNNQLTHTFIDTVQATYLTQLESECTLNGEFFIPV